MVGAVVSSMVNVAGGVGFVAALVGGREGHRPAARLTAIVAEGVEVVAPGEVTAASSGRGSSVVVQPSLQGGRVAGTVTLDRQVVGRGQEDRTGRVLGS